MESISRTANFYLVRDVATTVSDVVTTVSDRATIVSDAG